MRVHRLTPPGDTPPTGIPELFPHLHAADRQELARAVRRGVRRNVRAKSKFPFPPSKFLMGDGGELAHLPPHGPTAQVTAAEIQREIGAHPEYAFTAMVTRYGMDGFIRQVETARMYLRGPQFWALRPVTPGYNAYWLKHRAEYRCGEHLGYVGELALVAAALLEGLKHRPASARQRAAIFR